VNSPQFTHIAYDDFRVVRDNLAGGNHVTTGRQIPFSIAWLRAQSGVSSTIIGASTLEQLDGNLKAVDLILTPDQIAALGSVSKPVLNFPADRSSTDLWLESN
jgi:diketogulonate reductase-like aldo/keto reductase